MFHHEVGLIYRAKYALNNDNKMTSGNLVNYTVRKSATSNSPIPVLLIHGLFGGLENLNALAKHLSNDFDVISMDVRNHGNSFHSNEMTYPLMADDVLALLAHLNIEKLHIVGHSMGGKIAMQFALHHPNMVDKLVIADIAPVQYQHSHEQVINGLKSIHLDSLQNRKEADQQLASYVEEIGVRQFLLKNLVKSEHGFTWRANINNIANAYENIIAGNAADSPFLGDTLFIKGSNSDYITSEHRELIMRYFPNSKARVMSGVGHWLHAEKPVVFNKIVENFMKK